MLNRFKNKNGILIYPQTLKSGEVVTVLNGTKRPLSRILNDVSVHESVEKVIKEVADKFTHEIFAYFKKDEASLSDLDTIEKNWRQFDNNIDLHPNTARIATVGSLKNGHLEIRLTDAFKNLLPIEKAWQPLEDLIAHICRFSFAAIFTDDGDYRDDFSKAMEDSFPYEDGTLNRLHAVLGSDTISTLRFRTNLIDSAAVYMTADYLSTLWNRTDYPESLKLFYNHLVNRISSQVIGEYVRARFEKIDQEHQKRDYIARPRILKITTECSRYESHLLYSIQDHLLHEMQRLEAEMSVRQKLLKKNPGQVAKATLEREIAQYGRKRNQLVDAYTTPKLASQLPVNMLQNMPELKDLLEKRDALKKLKSTLSGNDASFLKLKRFHKHFISNEMEPIRRAKDSETIQFLKILGHLLLGVISGGLYIGGAMLYSSFHYHSVKFWLTPEEIFLQNVDKQLPKPAAPRIKITKYAD